MTIHDLDDGFGGGAGACREFSLPRDHDYSVLVGYEDRHSTSSQGHVSCGTTWNRSSSVIREIA